MNHSNCVISAVGRNSLHRMWLKGKCNFDLHLVVYDDSIEEFRGDTEYIATSKDISCESSTGILKCIRS